MSTKLILFGLVLFAIPIHAMKRSYPFKKEYSRNDHQNISDTKNIILIPDLTGIIEDIIVHHATEYPLAKKPKEATKTINALAQTNKRLHSLINDPGNNNKIIKSIAYNLYCSHETIAKMLHTQQAEKQFKLQYLLKKLCCSTYRFNQAGDRTTLITEKLDELIAQKVDLEFTYNHYNSYKTPLMLAANNNDNPMFELLLEKKVDINTYTSHGITILNFLTGAFPLTPGYCNYKKLIKLPGLNINQQNRYGETALLRCLVHRRSTTISSLFIIVIIKLLAAGADPEIANKYGVTPLMVAKKNLKNERIIHLIKLAIEHKHSTS